MPQMWGHQAPREPPTTRPGTTPSSSTQPTAMPPFPPPLPPFAFIPFSVPTPLPKLSTLSAEELKKLEGQEREAVEARIQLLRNIQLMLDSSVAMMQQYTFITSSNVLSTPQVSTTQTAPNGAKDASEATVNISPTSSGTSKSSLSNGSIVQQGDVTSSPGSSSEQDEIRRRRLQRLSQTTEQPAAPPAQQ